MLLRRDSGATGRRSFQLSNALPQLLILLLGAMQLLLLLLQLLLSLVELGLCLLIHGGVSCTRRRRREGGEKETDSVTGGLRTLWSKFFLLPTTRGIDPRTSKLTNQRSNLLSQKRRSTLFSPN